MQFEVNLPVLIKTVEDAGNFLDSRQNTPAIIQVKESYEVAGSADLESQGILKSAIREIFPELPVIFEEEARLKQLPDSFIACDELDGSSAYYAGLPDWGISVGIIHKGQPIVGVIHCPQRHIMLWAIKGKGAYRNGIRFHFQKTRTLEQSVIGFELNRLTNSQQIGWARAITMQSRGIRNLGVTTASIAELAFEQTGAFLNWKGGKIWDFAAGAIIIVEAGGLVTDIAGNNLNWQAYEMSALFFSGGAIQRQIFTLKEQGAY